MGRASGKRTRTSGGAPRRREWIGGRVRMPFYVMEPEPMRPDGVLWMEARRGSVVAVEVLPGDAPASALIAVLRSALADPTHAARPPQRLRVADPAAAELLRAGLEPKIDVVVAPTPEIDEALAFLADNLEEGGPAPSYLQAGAAPEAVARFFRAAGALYRAAPWKIIRDESQLLIVEAPRFGLGGAPLLVIGSLDTERGFLVFDSVEAYEAMVDMAAALEDGEGMPARPDMPVFSVTFDRSSSLPASIREEVEVHGWEIAEPDAYPLVLAWDPDGVPRPLRGADVELAAALCTALERLIRAIADAARDDVGLREEVVVEALEGRPTVAVFLPADELVERGDPGAPVA